MNNFYYTFYKLSQFVGRINGSDKDFLFTALIILSVLFGMNFLSIYFLLEDSLGFSLNIKIAPIIIMGIIYVINYYFLMRKDKGKKILDYYYMQSQAKRRFTFRSLLVLLYVILSVTACTVIAYVTKEK